MEGSKLLLRVEQRWTKFWWLNYMCYQPIYSIDSSFIIMFSNYSFYNFDQAEFYSNFQLYPSARHRVISKLISNARIEISDHTNITGNKWYETPLNYRTFPSPFPSPINRNVEFDAKIDSLGWSYKWLLILSHSNLANNKYFKLTFSSLAILKYRLCISFDTLNAFWAYAYNSSWYWEVWPQEEPTLYLIVYSTSMYNCSICSKMSRNR